VEAFVLSVSVEVVWEPLTGFGLNEQVGAGVPPPVTLQARFTAFAKPFIGVMETVEVPDAPTETVTGEVAEMEKSSAGPTTRLTDVLWLSEAEVPIIVRP
jgi:hypothetical protein